MNSTRVQAGQITTGFLENFTFNQTPNPDNMRVAAVAATLIAHQRSKEAILLSEQGGPSPWRLYGRREALDRRMR